MKRRLFPVVAVAILLATLFSGCGRKGPLVPPQEPAALTAPPPGGKSVTLRPAQQPLQQRRG